MQLLEQVLPKQSTGRFMRADWMKNPLPEVTIVGLGALGSWISLYLARMGCKLNIFDSDIAETVNMSAQLFGLNEDGLPKVEGLTQQLNNLAEEPIIKPYNERYEMSTEIVTPYMFACPDNIETRKLMFYKWRKQENRELFLDCRLSAEFFTAFCVQKGMEDKYEEFLYPKSEIIELPCAYKACTHIAAMSGSIIVNCFTNYIANKNLEMDLREIPFNITYDALFMNFTKL